MGAVRWERTEPPLALGRGLLTTTGVIGALLAIGVLWVMLPSGPDEDSALDPPSPLDTTDQLTSTSEPRTTFVTPTTTPPSSVASTVPATTRPGSPTPVATVALRRDAAPEPAVAVLVASGSLGVTTARALDQAGQADERFDIRLADGTTVSAGVLMVDSRSGLAVLTVPDGTTKDSFTMAAVPEAGGTLTILADRPRQIVMPGVSKDLGLRMYAEAPATTSAPPSTTAPSTSSTDDPTATSPPATTSPGATTTPSTAAPTTTTTTTSTPPTTTTTTTTPATTTTDAPSTTVAGSVSSRAAIVIGEAEGIDPASIPEGTPVVDAKGHLVGVCSHSDGESSSLMLVRLDALLRTGASQAANHHGWLGVAVGSGATPLTVTAVDPDGPAAGAGIAPGDRIVAVDGHSIATTDDLSGALSARRPGDKVGVTIAGKLGGPAQQTVTVTLGDRAAQL